MRFMGLLRTDNDSEAALPHGQKLLENMGKCMDEMTIAGVQFTCDGLLPSPKGARVKLSAGKVTVTGGPSIEVKGRTVPCAMFEVDSIMEAVEWTASLLIVLGEGECEIRPL
jgi:hypothetical protein